MSSRTSSRLALSCMAATILAASLLSCTSDLLGPVAHTWALQSVKDVPLPDTIPNSSPVIVVTSGTAVTNTNGTYSFSLTGTSDGNPGVVATDQGNWNITSSTFLFRSNTSGVLDYIGGLTSGSIRVAMPGQIVHSSDQRVDMVFTVVQ
ncbi:MAG: hypothetical protein JWO39_2895 [Gemmatimonadetes bacterium]|jgi:hypothetical protein|nr:hypothetical protein [Gemmatimonadota bacterium]